MNNGLCAILDTGAFIPVWTDSEDILVKDLGGKFIKSTVPVSGFGGTTFGNLYQVALQIGKLIFPNMPILANSELESPFNMILSVTMFSGLIYEVDTVNYKLNVTIPAGESCVRNIKIKSGKGNTVVLCNAQDDNCNTEQAASSERPGNLNTDRIAIP